MNCIDSKYCLALGTVITLAATPCADAQSVLPRIAASQSTSVSAARVPLFGADPATGTRNEARSQIVYATRELSGPFTIKALRFRADPTASNAAFTARLTIEISTSSKTFLQIIPWFEQNHGANRQVVFDGEISLPATTPGSWPEPWQAPIVLQTPFAFDPASGESLVIDFTIRDSTAERPWMVEQYRPDQGSMRTAFVSLACRNSRGNISAGASSGGIMPGRPLSIAFGGYPNNKPILGTGAILYGTSGIGGSYAGHTLPVLLTTIGLPSRSECYLAVDPVLAMPTIYTTGSTSIPSSALVWGRPNPIIPDLPAFYGATLFAQALSLDPDDVTGQPFLFPSQSIELRIGNGVKVEGTVVSSPGDAGSPSGKLSQDWAVTMRLDG